jgi:hypothetical protein
MLKGLMVGFCWGLMALAAAPALEPKAVDILKAASAKLSAERAGLLLSRGAAVAGGLSSFASSRSFRRSSLSSA